VPRGYELPGQCSNFPVSPRPMYCPGKYAGLTSQGPLEKAINDVLQVPNFEAAECYIIVLDINPHPPSPLPSFVAPACPAIWWVSTMAGLCCSSGRQTCLPVQMPAPGQAVYAACKACVDAYFRTLHSELWTR